MIFGKIDYINLLPFYVFFKRYVKSSSMRAAMGSKKSFPSQINRDFKARRVDGAFISSIESFRGNHRCYDVGIVAHGAVKSVLVKKGVPKQDPHSATSNALAKILKIDGEVIIGDKALKRYIEEPSQYVDLAQEWSEQTGLPFVFARFCANKHYTYYDNMMGSFLRSSRAIPYYMLQKFSDTRGISVVEIRAYLTLISYEINAKEKKGLSKFRALSQRSVRLRG